MASGSSTEISEIASLILLHGKDCRDRKEFNKNIPKAVLCNQSA